MGASLQILLGVKPKNEAALRDLIGRADRYEHVLDPLPPPCVHRRTGARNDAQVRALSSSFGDMEIQLNSYVHGPWPDDPSAFGKTDKQPHGLAKKLLDSDFQLEQQQQRGQATRRAGYVSRLGGLALQVSTSVR